MTLSIISPVYNSASTISVLTDEICKSLVAIAGKFEIILVDDGSIDDSWQTIEKSCALNSNIKGIKLDENYGQHEAILAGLEHSTGDWVVVMDCDLQDQPKEIIKLFEKAQQGYDVVLARRTKRKDHFFSREFTII